MTQPVKNHPCDACGQLDDHPMIHVGWGYLWHKDARTTVLEPSFHFDCLPPELEQLLGDAPQHAVTRSAIEAARSGVHGDELRAHIDAQPTDNDVEPEGHDVIPQEA